MEQETRYTAIIVRTSPKYEGFGNNGRVKSSGDNKCANASCVNGGVLIVSTLLSLIFGIIFVVLTAVGKENTSSHEEDNRCDCTLFTPSLGYGMAASLFIEVGIILAVLVFGLAAVACEKLMKLLTYYAFVSGSFIAVNFIGFLCMTLAVIVFVAMGGRCCSATSIAVASLSAVISALKIVFICIISCYTYLSDD